MTTHLCKTEPGDYSFDDLVRDKRTEWDGVSNPQACANIRSISKGDDILIYHTGSEKRIAGLARALSDAYEDPEHPGLTGAGLVKRPIFDIKPLKAATKTVTLADIKADDRFAEFLLVRSSRLSVMPVPAKLNTLLRRMTGLT